MEQRAAIEFFKAKKTAIEKSEMLKKAYGEECLPRTSVSQCMKG
jgi:hypothetical protein